MKTPKALLILAVTAAASTIYADKVPFTLAPPAVQRAIQSRAGQGRVEEIDRGVRNGQITYQVIWKNTGGAQQEIVVSEAGTILRDAVGASTGLTQDNLTLANKIGVGLPETPQPVQKAIHDQIADAPIDTIQRGIWNGQNIYEVVYHNNGRLKTFQVTEAGQPVVSQTPLKKWEPRYSNFAERNIPLPTSAKMALDAAPLPVQTTVRNMSNGARIEDFQRGDWNGRTVYQAAFRRDGQNVELQILDDGSILTRQPTTAVGAPAPGVTETVQP
jgi:hypothetical protein